MSFMKMRQLPSRPGFGDQARRAQQASRGQRMANIVGRYNNFWPREDQALWVAICPTQAWEYEAWNRETQEVELFKDQFWYGYIEHFVAQTKQRFSCSAGAKKDKPCWGCGIVNHHWDMIRAQEQETGVRSDKKPGVSRIQQFKMAVVLLEEITKVPAMKDGQQRKNRDGKPIMNDTPLALLPLAERKAAKAKGNTTFGLSMHWTNGSDGINQLTAIDRELVNRCANCAGHLQCVYMACPECTQAIQVAEDEDTPIGGEDLLQAREAEYKCDCGYEGRLFPITICTGDVGREGCGNPEDGKLIAFALRVKKEKTSDTKSVMKVVEIKPLQHFVDKYPVVEKLLMEPLDIKGICAPTPLESQLRMIPEHLRGDGVSPMPKQKEAVAVGYEFSPKGKRGAGEAAEDETSEDDVPY